MLPECKQRKELKKVGSECFRCKSMLIIEPEKNNDLVRFECLEQGFSTTTYEYESRKIVDEYLCAMAGF